MVGDISQRTGRDSIDQYADSVPGDVADHLQGSCMVFHSDLRHRQFVDRVLSHVGCRWSLVVAHVAAWSRIDSAPAMRVARTQVGIWCV
jgi:hypothetical protein